MTKIEISRRLKTVHFNTRVVLFDAIQCNSNSQRLYSPIRRAEHTSTQHAFYAVVLRVTESLCKGVLRRLESISLIIPPWHVLVCCIALYCSLFWSFCVFPSGLYGDNGILPAKLVLEEGRCTAHDTNTFKRSNIITCAKEDNRHCLAVCLCVC